MCWEPAAEKHSSLLQTCLVTSQMPLEDVLLYTQHEYEELKSDCFEGSVHTSSLTHCKKPQESYSCEDEDPERKYSVHHPINHYLGKCPGLMVFPVEIHCHHHCWLPHFLHSPESNWPWKSESFQFMGKSLESNTRMFFPCFVVWFLTYWNDSCLVLYKL